MTSGLSRMRDEWSAAVFSGPGWELVGLVGGCESPVPVVPGRRQNGAGLRHTPTDSGVQL